MVIDRDSDSDNDSDNDSDSDIDSELSMKSKRVISWSKDLRWHMVM